MPVKALIAVDGSANAESAFNFYLENLHREGNEVILGHVAEAPHQSFGFRAGLAVPHEQWEAMMKDAQKKIDDIKDKYADVLKQKNIAHKFVSESGHHPGHHIVHIAETESAQLLVLGTRGMGAVRRTILGSVSDYVLHHAHAPVVICRH